MRKYLVTTVVFGLLVLASAIPCFADAGAGMGVVCEATVVAGDSGNSGGGYYGGGYRYIEPDYSTTTTPTVPTVTVPPVIPAPPTYTPPPSEPLPQVTPAVGVPMPTEQGNIHIGWFLIGGGILVIGFMAWYLWGKRRKPKEIEPSQPI